MTIVSLMLMPRHKLPILLALLLVGQIVFVDIALALSLEDMMSPSEPAGTSNQQSGSLLGDVQNERSSRKKNVALKKYHSVNDEILRSCECLNSGNCSQRWGSKVWNKSQSYLAKEKQAIKEKQRVCLSAITLTVGASSSLDKILAAKETAIQNRNLLTNIDDNMVSRASSDRMNVKYEQKKADEKMAEIKRDAYRKRQWEAQAAIEAEVDAAWADSPVFGDSNFSDKLQRIQDQTMANIESQRASRPAQKPNQPTKNQQASTNSYMEKVISICASNGGVYNRSTNRCELQERPQPKNSASYEAEKANCLAAGKKWQSGGGCDYSSTIKIKGWSQGNTTTIQPGGSSQSSIQNNSNSSRSTPHNSPAPGSKNDERGDGYKPNNKSKNHSSTGGAGKSNKNKDTTEVAMIVVRKENPHSWPTQEEACIYAKLKVIDLAKKQCKLEYRGVPATIDDVPIPVHANCQSYRQMTKSGFTTEKGQWKTTGNVTFYCRLPKPFN